jgi:hypothetical protein
MTELRYRVIKPAPEPALDAAPVLEVVGITIVTAPPKSCATSVSPFALLKKSCCWAATAAANRPC